MSVLLCMLEIDMVVTMSIFALFFLTYLLFFICLFDFFVVLNLLKSLNFMLLHYLICICTLHV